jgi:hypothetical protein
MEGDRTSSNPKYTIQAPTAQDLGSVVIHSEKLWPPILEYRRFECPGSRPPECERHATIYRLTKGGKLGLESHG